MKKLLQYVLPAVVVAGFAFTAQPAAAHTMMHKDGMHHSMMRHHDHCRMVKVKRMHHGRTMWMTKRVCR